MAKKAIKGTVKSVKNSKGTVKGSDLPVNLTSEVYFEKVEQCVSREDFEALKVLVDENVAKYDEKVKKIKGTVKMTDYMENNADIVFSRFFGEDNLGETDKEKNVYRMRVSKSLAKHLKISREALWNGYNKFMRDSWIKKQEYLADTIKTIDEMGEDKWNEFNENLTDIAW